MSMIQDFVQPKKRARKIMGANLAHDEYDTMDAIINWRIAQGYSTDRADCLRQMMHFVVNKEYLKRYDFIQPDADTISELINQAHEPAPEPTQDGQ